MKDLKFRVKNEEHSTAIQQRLFELGYRWAGSGKVVKYQEEPYIYCGKDDYISYSDEDEFFFSNHKNKEATLDDLFDVKKGGKVKLNDEYTATIKDGVVRVGCQEFSFKVIKNLYKAVKQSKDE